MDQEVKVGIIGDYDPLRAIISPQTKPWAMPLLL